MKPFTNSFKAPIIISPEKNDLRRIKQNTKLDDVISKSSSTFNTSSTTLSIEDDLKLYNLKINKILEDINNIPHSPNETTNNVLTNIPSLIPFSPSSFHSPSSTYKTLVNLSPNLILHHSTSNEITLINPSHTPSNKIINRCCNHFYIIQKQKIQLQERKINLLEKRNKIELQKVQVLQEQTKVLKRIDNSILKSIFQ